LKGECNVELLLQHNNKKLITHVNQLKPYFVQKPAAVSSPDFFPPEKVATPPPTVEQQNNDKEDFIEDKFFPYKQEVIRTDPSNFRTTRATRQHPHHCTFSSSSSVYGDSPEVSVSDPSPAGQPTYAQVTTRPRKRLSSSSSMALHHSLPSNSIAARTRSRSRSLTPERPKIYMPQITFDPLPVLKEGEGLEENENLAISIVDGHNSWTLVKRKKKNKRKKDDLSEKWTKQQKENFERFGDIWYQEPYKNYHVSDFATPAVAAPQPQAQIQQQPVLQQQPVGQPQPPVLPPQQPIVVPPQLLPPQPIQAAPLQPPQNVQPPIPTIVVTPPRRNAHQRCKSNASRPFQRRTRLLAHDAQTSRLRIFLWLRELWEAAYLK
jgi:hypothetical protein